MVDAGYVTVEGSPIHWEARGEGEPLVLLHGGLLTAELTFGALLAPLAARRRLVAIELEGHGRTPDSDRPLSIGRLADDTAAVLGQLGVGRADVFGFSLGASVALALAMRHGTRVRRLVLAGAPVRPEGWHDDVRPGAPLTASPRLPSSADFAAMEAAFRAVAPDPDAFGRVARKMGGMLAAFPGWSDEELARLESPTLILVGDHDFVRLEHVVEMQRLLPDARLAVLPETTHIQLLRRREPVMALVMPFLEG